MKCENVLTRFNEKYIVDTKTGCWIWQGMTDSSGECGMFLWENEIRVTARQAAWRLFRDEIPLTRLISKCRNSLCVNPSHVRLDDEDTRFYAKINKQKNGCWIWIGATDPDGRGKFLLGSGRMITVHTYLLNLQGIETGKGVFVKRTCSSNGCVNPIHYVVANAEYRFWKFVDKESSDKGCWLWTGSLNKGYGKFNHIPVHRYAYEKFVGPIPEGMDVLHKCDVRNCVCSDHFFLGTNTDNQADKFAKGRQAKGENNGEAKLTEVQAREIKTLLKQGWKAIDIIRQKGYTRNEVYMISTGNTWKWLEV